MATTSSTIQIATPDGAMSGFLARPSDDGKYPAVLVIMEAFGLNQHIKDVATRIAGEGYVALAPDVYYRQPNAVVGYDQLPDAIRLMTSLRDDAIVSDLSAAVSHLQAQPFVRADRIGITGFCMGGRISFLSACTMPTIKAAAPFYGGGIGSLLDRAGGIACPMLLFFGDQDPFIPNEEVATITATLRDLKKNAEVKVYAGAPHGFFCNERDSYRADAAADAWTRLTTFLARHLKS
ncbi:dienelactone hydrolase family protein [bacterium]|nr:dienelactone hydrolase family protein [bacterium]